MSNRASAVISFPSTERIRREHTLRVASDAACLLEVAVREGNATVVNQVFAALGAYSSGRAMPYLLGLKAESAEVVKLGAP